VLADELNKIVNEQMGKYLEENKYELFGEAIPVREDRLELNCNEPRSYEFSYEIGIQPPVNLSPEAGSGKVFTRYRIPPTEEEIGKELERLLKKYGTREDVELVAENDVIYAYLHQVNEDGSEVEGGLHADSYLNLQMVQE
jgi:trigger factor